jgi:D-alanyl-D-alanine carboxypeptidase (penicillin-binding protein 5/6)
MRLISVVLGTRSENARAQETQKLLNFGFRFFETHELYKAGQEVTETKVWKGQQKQLKLGLASTLSVTVPRGKYKELVATTNLNTPIVAPISQGSALGEVQIRLGDQLIATQPLVAIQTVEQGSWFRRIIDTILMLIWG